MTRLRRVAVLYLLLLGWFVACNIVAAACNASTGQTTPVNWLDHVPVPYLAAIIGANLIPYLSALATKKPGWWTGAVTVALSLLDAVVGAVAHGGNDDWRHVAAVTAGAWIVARLHLRTFLAGTKVEADLHAHGYTGHHRASDAGAAEPRPLFLVCAFGLVLLLIFTGHAWWALVAAVICAIAALVIK